jgi:hypothetical protein
VARADHIAYLADTAMMNDLWSLTVESYAFNRAREFISGDYILFRPVLYFLLGFEKWLYGYNFFWWQLTNLLLHLCVIWLLLRILLNEGKHIFAPLFVLWFSVQYTSMEMVIWHHLSGYLLFSILLLGAIYNLRRLKAEKSLYRETLMFFCFLVASFTYELGNAASLLAAAYMILSNRLSSDNKQNKYNRRIIILTFAVPIVYIMASMLDLYLRFGDISATGQVSAADPVATIGNILSASSMWFFTGFIPTLMNMRAGGRVEGRVEIDGLNDIVSLNVLINIGLTICLFLFYIIILYRSITKDFVKRNLGIIFLILSVIFSYAAIIVMGRINERDFMRVMENNTYYSYMPNLLSVILLYLFMNVPALQKNADRFLLLSKVGFTLNLAFIIVINASLVYAMNVKMVEYSEPRIKLVKEIEELVARFGNEEDFSFSIDEDCPGNDILPWLKKRGDPPDRNYSLAEALYPQYYKKVGGKYIVSCGDKNNGGLLPILVEEGYRGFNIIRYGDKYYGLDQNEGAFYIDKVEKKEYKRYFIGNSVNEVKQLIDKSLQ